MGEATIGMVGGGRVSRIPACRLEARASVTAAGRRQRPRRRDSRAPRGRVPVDRGHPGQPGGRAGRASCCSPCTRRPSRAAWARSRRASPARRHPRVPRPQVDDGPDRGPARRLQPARQGDSERPVDLSTRATTRCAFSEHLAPRGSRPGALAVHSAGRLPGGARGLPSRRTPSSPPWGRRTCGTSSYRLDRSRVPVRLDTRRRRGGGRSDGAWRC